MKGELVFGYFKEKLSRYIEYRIEIRFGSLNSELKKSKVKVERLEKKIDSYIEKQRQHKADVSNKEIKKNFDNSRLELLTKDGIWFYSLMKSGTTYTINFLINYINIHYNNSKEPVSKSDLVFFHSVNNRNSMPGNIISRQDTILSKVKYKTFIHTHFGINSFAEKNIFILRNPLDYIVSAYFWFYKDRERDEPISEVWRKLADDFIKTYKFQVNERNSDCFSLRYEDIVSGSSFIDLLEYLELEFNKSSYDKALLFSSKDYVKRMEKGASPIIGGHKVKRDSFIRSGQVGDWKSYIDEKLKLEILTYIENHGVDVTSFRYE
ncbi:putative Sulfotransferase domain-containing protein [Vibrio chagasii]|nr:putative Sulfotransferase domain-containing protein [Vibrio chagasii]CAH6909296.1 putative Sulfotransferase domain-containing protein [Vibrio chagasii]